MFKMIENAIVSFKKFFGLEQKKIASKTTKMVDLSETVDAVTEAAKSATTDEVVNTGLVPVTVAVTDYGTKIASATEANGDVTRKVKVELNETSTENHTTVSEGNSRATQTAEISVATTENSMSIETLSEKTLSEKEMKETNSIVFNEDGSIWKLDSMAFDTAEIHYDELRTNETQITQDGRKTTDEAYVNEFTSTQEHHFNSVETQFVGNDESKHFLRENHDEVKTKNELTEKNEKTINSVNASGDFYCYTENNALTQTKTKKAEERHSFEQSQQDGLYFEESISQTEVTTSSTRKWDYNKNSFENDGEMTTKVSQAEASYESKFKQTYKLDWNETVMSVPDSEWYYRESSEKIDKSTSSAKMVLIEENRSYEEFGNTIYEEQETSTETTTKSSSKFEWQRDESYKDLDSGIHTSLFETKYDYTTKSKNEYSESKFESYSSEDYLENNYSNYSRNTTSKTEKENWNIENYYADDSYSRTYNLDIYRNTSLIKEGKFEIHVNASIQYFSYESDEEYWINCSYSLSDAKKPISSISMDFIGDQSSDAFSMFLDDLTTISPNVITAAEEKVPMLNA